MDRKNWVRLDNASNIFLAARNEIDTKVFRLSAEVENLVQPDILQKALDKTYDQYALYHSVLRRGVFWYYLEKSDLRPKVELERKSPCEQIYHNDRRELLFRVMYFNNRIHLEVFHALSDGTGALWFFRDLLTEYLFLRHTDDHIEEFEKMSEHVKEQLEDSFFRYFRHRRQDDFTAVAESALEEAKEELKEEGIEEYNAILPDYSLKSWYQSSYQIEGHQTLDNRTHVTELSMPVRRLLDLAHEENVSLTVYLTALFMIAVNNTSPPTKKGKNIRLSLPVNLRQMFPSNSPRNFFTAVYLAYTFYPDNEVNITNICKSLHKQLKSKTTKEYLQQRLQQVISFEFNPFIRGVIRPIKDLILKGINWGNNRQVTIALSNLGRVQLPEPLSNHVRGLYFHTSAVRPQMSVVSHKDKLTVSFSSPFIETKIEKEFVQLLSKQNVPISVASNKIRYSQIEGEEP